MSRPPVCVSTKARRLRYGVNVDSRPAFAGRPLRKPRHGQRDAADQAGEEIGMEMSPGMGSFESSGM